MNRILILAVLLLTGCGLHQQTAVPPSIALDPQTAATQGTPIPGQTEVPAGEAALPGLTLESGGLQVVLFTSLETETSSQPYRLEGSAPAGTVLTINEQILVVDDSQFFQVEVALEDGPNLVEVIASNAEGDEVECLLTIYYNP